MITLLTISAGALKKYFNHQKYYIDVH